MIDKAKMAHDHAMKYFEAALKDNADSDFNFKLVSLIAWEYDEAMQAEADKRKVVGVPEAIRGSRSQFLEHPL